MSWFGNAKSWSLVPLKDIATLKRGYDLPVDQRNSGNVPIYAANGKNGSHDEVKTKAPGVVTGRSGTIGKVHYVTEDYWPLNTALYVTDFYGNDPKWVYYMLQAFKLERFVEGAGVPTLNRNLVHGELIPLPPLPEQQRIAAILDKADAIRRKRQQALQLADEFLRSVFLEMFGDPVTNPKGWEVKPLGSLSLKFSDGPFGSNLKSEHYKESGIRVIRLQNIGVGKFIDNNAAYVSNDHFNILKKHECIAGDVIVGTLGDPNLRACIQPEWLSVALNKADCVQIRPNNEVANADFICALLNQPATENMAKELMHGQTRIRISMGSLRNLEVPVPPIELQREFARRVQKVEGLKAKLKASQAQAEAQFNALSQRAFAGEL